MEHNLTCNVYDVFGYKTMMAVWFMSYIFGLSWSFFLYGRKNNIAYM